MGRAVQFVAVNAGDAQGNQMDLTIRAAFPLFQDLPEVRAWGLHRAGKDDLLLYDRQGRLHRFLPTVGPVSTNLSTPEGYQNVKAALLAIP